MPHLPRALAATLCASLALITSSLQAEELFSLTATGGSTTVTGTGSNVVDLAGDVIDSQGQFASLAGSSFNGSLRYGRMENAVLFSRNAAGTSAALTIPSTGFTKTFNAANENDLEDQIRDFFEQDGADAYADFLAEINKQTALGGNDGNPLATTAMLADMGFYRFGFVTRKPSDEVIRLPAGLDLTLAGGVDDADDANGWYAQGGLAASFSLGERVSLVWANNFRYRDVEGASIYQYGTTVALPITILPGYGGGFPISWRLTPAFVGGFGGSWDLAAGGILVGGQLTSSLAYSKDGWTIAMGNQIGFYEGVPIDISDFRFETDTSQVILKNGVQLIRDLGDGAFIDLGIAYTNLLEDAFVEDYLSPSIGLGARFGSGLLRVGYRGDFADDFTNHGGNVALIFSY